MSTGILAKNQIEVFAKKHHYKTDPGSGAQI